MMFQKAFMLAALVFIANVIGVSAERFRLSDEKEADIQMRLKQLNKTPVKTIHSPDGDIIDCINIMEQPAFDHPLMKNHKIQMSPSLNKINESQRAEVPMQLWRTVGECPEKTVPIKRVTREHLLASDAMMESKRINSFNVNSSLYSNNVHEYAIVNAFGDFYGMSASLNVWKPKIRVSNEFSLAQIWFSTATNTHVTVLEAGWQIYPMVNGDSDMPKLFSYYTTDSYQSGSGCYNTECPGFVQVSQKVAMGATIQRVSTYDGDQYEINFGIERDYRSGDWWLVIDSELVGYWPKDLVPNLMLKKRRATWGGEIMSTMRGQHTTTEMGSGHFAKEQGRRAAYFNRLKVVSSENVFVDPPELYPSITNSNCYSLDVIKTPGTYGLYYGGPGRNPDCP